MVVVGIFLIVFGVIFIALGAVGAAATVFAKKGFALASPTIVQILKLIPDLINALRQAPSWEEAVSEDAHRATEQGGKRAPPRRVLVPDK